MDGQGAMFRRPRLPIAGTVYSRDPRYVAQQVVRGAPVAAIILAYGPRRSLRRGRPCGELECTQPFGWCRAVGRVVDGRTLLGCWEDQTPKPRLAPGRRVLHLCWSLSVGERVSETTAPVHATLDQHHHAADQELDSGVRGVPPAGLGGPALCLPLGRRDSFHDSPGRRAAVCVRADRSAAGREQGNSRVRCSGISSAAACVRPSWRSAMVPSASGPRYAKCGQRRPSSAAGCTGSPTSSTSCRSACSRGPSRPCTRCCTPTRGPRASGRSAASPRSTAPVPEGRGRTHHGSGATADPVRLSGGPLETPADDEPDRVDVRDGSVPRARHHGRRLAHRRLDDGIQAAEAAQAH
jgi:hypothetical protein